MNVEKNHIIYTAEDIQRYLSGGMSNAEMYAIEKAALDDPFLAEAIEGYEAMEKKDWNKELVGLKKRLDIVENAPVAPVYRTAFTKWWKAAAAVLVIGSTIAVAYLFTSRQPGKNVTLAETALAKDPAVVAKTDTAINAAADSMTTAAIVLNQNSTSATATQTDSAKQILLADVTTTKKQDNDFVYTPSPVTAGRESKDIAGSPQRDDEQKTNAGAAAINQGSYNMQSNEALADKSLTHQNNTRAQNNNALDNYKFKSDINTNYFNAQVVTPDNKPIAYANVMPQTQNKKPLYTDAKGKFGLTAADSTLSVVVTSPGYAPQKYTLQNSAEQNKIVLQPAEIATKEITAARGRTSAKAESKKEAEMTEEIEEEEAEPFGGWVEYNNYLNNNLVFPNEAKEKNIHGEVELAVKLNSKGEVSKVKVDKTLCAECDAEAVRLVKEGPKWEVKKNKASKAKVKIKF